jgi:DNA processing protein
MKDEILYYLGFSHFLGIGPIKFLLLKKHFSSVKKAYLSEKNELEKVIGPNLAEKFIKFRESFDLEKKLEELNKKEIFVLTVDDKKYPENLRSISDPPICLYVKGNPDLLSQSNLFFAIVGTRQPTSYGIQVAEKFAFELAKEGVVIVSGLAYGIDTIAHKKTLEAGGKTIAVLGCGVDVVYPAANRDLYQKIIKTGSAIVSEFPPGQLVKKGLFIARNRIISALSKGVMVVEGTQDSGSLITARYAAEQGKDVFAPPSPLTSKMSQAPNILLKQGAKLVTDIDDIFNEFGLKITPKKQEDIKKNLSSDEIEIFQFLEKKPLKTDEIALLIKKPINQILNTLSLMEIKGIIKKNQENYYEIIPL